MELKNMCRLNLPELVDYIFMQLTITLVLRSCVGAWLKRNLIVDLDVIG